MVPIHATRVNRTRLFIGFFLLIALLAFFVPASASASPESYARRAPLRITYVSANVNGSVIVEFNRGKPVEIVTDGAGPALGIVRSYRGTGCIIGICSGATFTDRVGKAWSGFYV